MKELLLKLFTKEKLTAYAISAMLMLAAAGFGVQSDGVKQEICKDFKTETK